MTTVLTTSRYVPPGAYIGQLITPRPGNLTADARATNFLGKGSNLAQVKNSAIRRSFVFEEELTLPLNAPFQTTLVYPSNGIKDRPARLFDSITGVELRQDQWNFVKTGNIFNKVIISTSAHNSNAVYKIDYQSISRDVKDPLPVVGLRSVKALGTVQDRAEFKDFIDFFIPYTFAGPSIGDLNFLPDPILTSIFPDGSNTGGSAVAQDMASVFNHKYNRFYELEVTAISGISGSFTATFEWSARNYSGGLNAAAPTPVHSSVPRPSFTVLEATPATHVQDMEFGIKSAFAFSVTNYAIGDRFYFNGVGPGLIEFDGRLLNSNQYLDFTAPVPTLQFGSTGGLSYSGANDYTDDRNTKFKLQVTAISGSVGSRSVTFGWAKYGEEVPVASTSTALETAGGILTLTNGVELVADYGASQFVVGDVFNFEVLAPRKFYQAKDDRTYKLAISVATNPGTDAGFVEGSYETGTPEGGFGSWSANVNLLSGPSAQTGYFALPGGVLLAVRNAMRGNINGTSYVAADAFTAAIASDAIIDWSLTSRVEEIRETSAFMTDVTGAVTGFSGSVYVILDSTPQQGSVFVEDEDTATPISFIEITGTRFVAFVTAPSDSVRITYEFRGKEASPGQLYYLTANYLRPTSLYNNPTLILDKQDGRSFLAPSQSDNHLYIMNDIAFENGVFGAFYTQVFDADGDGILTTVDVEEALTAHEKISRATDLCLLSLFESLGSALAVNERANDPFEKREQMIWVGAPIGTPIGDIDTPNSLVAIARSVLQVPPQSPAQGTRVLLAPTECTVEVLLDNNVTQTVTLDGSFVAGATSSKVNSFSTPSNTILRSTLAGFKTIKMNTEPENIILGQNSILWMSDRGNSSFRYEEDITVHTLSEEFQLISATVQKQFVTKVVRREMDENLVSVVVPSAEAGVALIRATLAGIMVGLLGRGLIAPFQTVDGSVREFDPDADIVVFRGTGSLTLYHFYYAYWIFAPIKRLFGLYSLNSNDFGLGT